MSFQCTECDYKCDHQSTLDDHMKTRNPNINAEIYMDPTQEVIEYECTICDYKCNYEHILIAHMKLTQKKNLLHVQNVKINMSQKKS